MLRSNAASSAQSADSLKRLAGRVRRLCPDHRNPERFHEEKSEIAHEIATLARAMADAAGRPQWRGSLSSLPLAGEKRPAVSAAAKIAKG